MFALVRRFQPIAVIHDVITFRESTKLDYAKISKFDGAKVD